MARTHTENVIYRTLDTQSDWVKVYLDGKNVQIDPKKVSVGDTIQIAMKEDIKPPSVKSPEIRIMAPYVEKVVISPDKCCCGHDPDDCSHIVHASEICPKCIEGWCWDWLIRSHPRCQHGTQWMYRTFGCRCPICREWDRSDRIERGVTTGTRPSRKYFPPGMFPNSW